jgi:two-component system, cell cycle sensor histidine kinase and response regulator CckA
VRVLVVDDEEMIRSLAERVLRKAGIEVTSAGTGGDGLAASLADPTITLAIVDMTLPDMDGLELIGRLRLRNPDLKCVLSTGHALTEQDLPSELRGHVAFLPKPYRSQALIELVRQATGTSAPATSPSR